MKQQTVADLMGQQGGRYTDAKLLMREADESEKPESQTDQVFTVSLVLNPSEVVIINQKVVIEKRVIARNRREALEICGFTVKI